MNLFYPPEELERLGRMADQTHPAVLPHCVKTLQTHAENLRGSLEALEAFRQERKQRLTRVVGATMLANASLTAQFVFLSEINDWDVNPGLVIGASLVSALSLNALTVGISQRVQKWAYESVRETTQQVTVLYHRAYDRAVSLGVIPAQPENQISQS